MPHLDRKTEARGTMEVALWLRKPGRATFVRVLGTRRGSRGALVGIDCCGTVLTVPATELQSCVYVEEMLQWVPVPRDAPAPAMDCQAQAA